MTGARANSRSAMVWALAAFFLVGVVGLVWTPYDPQAQAFSDLIGRGGTSAHWLGVDALGRDLLSRVWAGTGHTIVFAGVAALGTLGMAGCLLALERNGPAWMGRALQVVASVGLAMPVIFVGLVLAVFMPRSAWTLVLAAALGGVPFGYRQLRIVWIEQAGALHVTASRALGAGAWHLARFSIWPNIRGQVGALARLLFAVGVLELSGLTFLGLAVDPDLLELGALLRNNQSELLQHPGLVIWPGVVLSGMLLLVHLSNVRKVA